MSKKLSQRRRNLIIAAAVIIAATLAFIWGSSVDAADASTAKSGLVMRIVSPTLELFVGSGKVTDHLVRKLAHFFEFCALGGEMTLFAALRHRKGLQPVINCLSVGLYAAVLDESIQYFSPGRSPQVSDVLLDFSGVAAGVAVMLIVCAVGSDIRSRKREKLEMCKSS